jgi:hypothetical protein
MYQKDLPDRSVTFQGCVVQRRVSSQIRCRHCGHGLEQRSAHAQVASPGRDVERCVVRNIAGGNNGWLACDELASHLRQVEVCSFVQGRLAGLING